MTMKSLIAIALFTTAAFLAPGAAEARSQSDHEHATLVVKLVPPLVFSDATVTCPEGVLTFGLASTAGSGTGSACFLSATPTTPCSADVCQVVASTIAFALRRGTITVNSRQFEMGTFDPTSGAFAITARFEGTVTHATRRFHKLTGAPVRGDGVTTFAADGTIMTTVAFVIREDNGD